MKFSPEVVDVLNLAVVQSAPSACLSEPLFHKYTLVVWTGLVKGGSARALHFMCQGTPFSTLFLSPYKRSIIIAKRLK